MRAKINRETEKALNLTYMVEIYGEFFTCKNVWFPKSMIEETSRDGAVIFFGLVHNWYLDKKTKEYCKGISDAGFPLKSEIKTYLSNINNEIVTECWC